MVSIGLVESVDAAYAVGEIVVTGGRAAEAWSGGNTESDVTGSDVAMSGILLMTEGTATPSAPVEVSSRMRRGLGVGGPTRRTRLAGAMA